MIEMELIKNTEKLLEKELKSIVEKGSISPNDLENMKKVFCVIGMLDDFQNGRPVMGEENSYGYRGYSNGWALNRTPDYYGNPYMNQYGNQYGGNQYGMDGESSYGRSRSPVTGRYISNGVNGGNSGYSGHSIEDRMIASLEQQMDNANSDYERQMIQEEIKRIRMGTR